MSGPRLLALAWAKQHRNRAILVISAIALATSLVVFTVSGYQAALKRSAGLAADLMGPTDLILMPTVSRRPFIVPEVEEALRAAAEVATVQRTSVLFCDVEDANDSTYYEMWRAAFIATIDGKGTSELREGRWPDTGTGVIEGVLSGGLARRWRVGVGDTMPMHGRSGEHQLTIVGITDEMLSHRKASGVFVTPAALAALAGGTRHFDRLYVDLADGVETAAFLEAWKPQFAAADPPVTAHDLSAYTAELGNDKAITRMRQMSAAAAAMVLVASIFIVYTAMSAGAGERHRQLALLRTIGATRAQVRRAVLLESIVLALAGCCVGVPLGWAFLQVLALAQADLFAGPVMPDLMGLIIGIGATLLATLVAGMLPAWSAGRVRPLDAMAQQAEGDSDNRIALRAAIAVTLLSIAILVIPLGAGQGVATMSLTTSAGLVFLAISAILIAGPTIRLVEQLGGRLYAAICGLPAELLRHQGGPHLSRAGGTVLTIAVCLGFSVTMNVWGRSMVVPYLPSPQLPDQVISILPGGVPPTEAGRVADLRGVDPNRVVPMVVEMTSIGSHLAQQTGGTMDEIYVQIIGIDPAVLAPASGDVLLPIDGAGVPAADLAAAVAEPGTALIPPSFAQRFGLVTDAAMVLHRCGGGRHEVPLKVAGVASLPGWHWITKMGRMRSLEGKPFAPIIMSTDTIAMLGVTRVRHWLADTIADLDASALRRDLQAVAERFAGEYESAHFGMGGAQRPTAKMIATGEVARRIQERSDKTIWVLGAIPLGSLLVAVLGVANAVAAGIRMRRWEFGVMRSIGLERGHARRLVLAEMAIIATAAGVISVAYGITAAWAGIDISLQLLNTGSSSPGLSLPWLDMLLAWVATMAVCLVATLMPSRGLARSQPLDLLQAGRASS